MNINRIIIRLDLKSHKDIVSNVYRTNKDRKNRLQLYLVQNSFSSAFFINTRYHAEF